MCDPQVGSLVGDQLLVTAVDASLGESRLKPDAADSMSSTHSRRNAPAAGVSSPTMVMSSQHDTSGASSHAVSLLLADRTQARRRWAHLWGQRRTSPTSWGSMDGGDIGAPAPFYSFVTTFSVSHRKHKYVNTGGRESSESCASELEQNG